MSLASLANSKPAAVAVGVGVAAVALYVIGRRVFKELRRGVADFNEGTPYENHGPIGTLGNVANEATGGWLDDLGGWLGRTVYDWTHPEYDPNQ